MGTMHDWELVLEPNRTYRLCDDITLCQGIPSQLLQLTVATVALWDYETCVAGWPGGGVLSTKDPIQGCATIIGSKISLLVYEWPLIKCKFGMWMHGSICQNFPKFEPKYLRKLWKNQAILFKFGTNWSSGSLFLENLVFVWIYFQILWQHIPTKTKLEYPPWRSQGLPEWASCPPGRPKWGKCVEKRENLQENDDRLRKCSYLVHPGVRDWLWPCQTPPPQAGWRNLDV